MAFHRQNVLGKLDGTDEIGDVNSEGAPARVLPASKVPSLLSRITKIEARIKDRSGLVPHSPGWLDYWELRMARILTEEESGNSGQESPFLLDVPSPQS